MNEYAYLILLIPGVALVATLMYALWEFLDYCSYLNLRTMDNGEVAKRLRRKFQGGSGDIYDRSNWVKFDSDKDSK